MSLPTSVCDVYKSGIKEQIQYVGENCPAHAFTGEHGTGT